MRIDPATFEADYAARPDPWNFESSPYEQHKYSATVAALSRNRYRRVFEPGASIGVLSEHLAERAEELICCEPSPTACATARKRLARHSNVTIETASIPDWLPEGSFDLIVMSEMAYYFDEDELSDLLSVLSERLDAPAELLAVHWRGRSDDHLLTAEEAHEVFARHFGTPTLSLIGGVDNPDHHDGYLLQRWEIVGG